MKKFLLTFIAIFSTALLTAQNITSKKWLDLFSYNNILVIRETDGKMVAATENGIFYYDLSSGTITKLSKANGLHEVKITAFDINPQTKIGLVGYRNGALDVITPDGSTLSVDIPIAPSFNGDKRINHISITGDKAIISVNYGVSVFDLKKKEFAQSAFFVNGSVYEAAREATLKDDKVYAATATGLKSHDLNITFPVYSTWNTVLPGDFTQIDSDAVIACSTVNQMYLGNGVTFSAVPQVFTDVGDIVVNPDNVVVTDGTRIYTFSVTGSTLSMDSVGELCNTASRIAGKIFAGTRLSGVKDLSGVVYKPDGPYNNLSSKISLHDNQIWVATARRDDYNQPINSNLGYYHFDGNTWIYPEYFKTSPYKFNVFDVKPNPANPAEVFFSNYTFEIGEKGIFRMENNEFKKQYKANDSDQFHNRPEGISFDENSNLMVFCGFYDGGVTESAYYYYNRPADDFNIVPLPNARNSQNFITKDGMMYAACTFFTGGGLIMKNYGNNPAVTNAPQKVIRSEHGLPTDGVISVAVDNNEDVWIGTYLGLRILQNPKSAVNDLQPKTEPIIIEQNGIAEEVFRDSSILQIKVDSGNHKWISVDDGGVYYLSANGERTIKHFTKENSPLPTNSVTDIAIDEKTGRVYFVTQEGIVAYQGDVAGVNSEFGNVLVYPNPVVTSNFKGMVTIRGLAMKTNIRITDAAGNLVHQAVANGGFYDWDLNNQRGKRVASGIYFVLMTNEDGTDKATAKIAVVN